MRGGGGGAARSGAAAPRHSGPARARRGAAKVRGRRQQRRGPPPPPGLAARPGNAQARAYLHCAWQSFVHALITRWEHCPSHGRFVWQSVPFEFE